MRERIISPEALDALPAQDPRAQLARRDLLRVNRVIGTRHWLLSGLEPPPVATGGRLRMLELGAGDGRVMLQIARAVCRRWPPVDLTLLDRLPLVAPDTAAEFQRCGWTVHLLTTDVLHWAGASAASAVRWDLIVTNLFLHHFRDPQLAALLGAVASRCRRFVACEPRRAMLPLIGSHLIGALGVSAVTRQDAVISVRAGFCRRELSALWNEAAGTGWTVREKPAGLFGHLFWAARSAA